MEIMRLTFKMDMIIAAAPGGLIYNLDPTQVAIFNNLHVKKAELVSELFKLMSNDNDI